MNLNTPMKMVICISALNVHMNGLKLRQKYMEGCFMVRDVDGNQLEEGDFITCY